MGTAGECEGEAAGGSGNAERASFIREVGGEEHRGTERYRGSGQVERG